MATPTRDELLEALTGFRLAVRNHRGYQEAGEIAHPEDVADVLHATLSRIAAERSPDLGAIDPDDLTQFLDLIRSDADQESMTHDPEDCADWRNSCTAHNTMRLVAMVKATLELAGEFDTESDQYDDLSEKPGTDEEGRPLHAGQAIAYRECAADLREAITRELAGSQPGEGESSDER
jgi:hypothetical protein